MTYSTQTVVAIFSSHRMVYRKDDHYDQRVLYIISLRVVCVPCALEECVYHLQNICISPDYIVIRICVHFCYFVCLLYVENTDGREVV